MKRLWPQGLPIVLATVTVGSLVQVTTPHVKKHGSPRLPVYTDRDLTPRFVDPDTASDLHRVGSFQLTDQHGTAVTAADLEGRISVVSFFFARCPAICPSLISNLERARQAFAGDDQVVLFSVSIDPQTDSVAVLSHYARLRRIDGRRWHLLTGQRDAVYALARRSFFAESTIPGARGQGDFLHTELVYLVDGRRRIRGVYNGLLPLDMPRLVDDIRALKLESVAG